MRSAVRAYGLPVLFLFVVALANGVTFDLDINPTPHLVASPPRW